MFTVLVCPWCQADRWSERFHIPVSEGPTLVLCAHTAEQIHRTLHTVEGSCPAPAPLLHDGGSRLASLAARS